MTHRFLKLSLLLGLALSPLYPAKAQPTEPLFPFVIPWDDAAKNATDVSFLNPAPLEEKHRVTARDGHFFDQTRRRVRFLGVNTSFGANFPDKADAEKIAARLHKYGINIVRLHHMDGRKAPQGLWSKDFPDMQHIDAGQLDRLDYFVAQLKNNGIYVDLNLHVSRKFTPADGFPEAESLPHNGKVTAWFEPRMVELQKQYAREMLSHHNPYTNQTYAQDPAVALIEIHNEDSMLDAARDGRITGLPEYYRGLLVAGWNKFLQAKYPSTAALLAAWNGPEGKPSGNLIANNRFEDQTAGWRLEKTAPAPGAKAAQGSIATEDIPAGGVVPPGRALHLKTDAVGDAHWHLQANYGGLDFQDRKNYNLKFWARSKTPRMLTVYTKMEAEPWQDVGLRQYVSLTPEWKQFELNFTAKNPLPGRNRLTFVMGDAVNEVWIADLQLHTGFALPEGQSLEQGNLNLASLASSPWGEDYARYLMEIEREYADGMRDYIKQDLGARGMVTCSQSSYGGMAGVWRESKMDFVDMHAYWQHPSFPRRPWDMKDWFIRNTPMVSEAKYGTLPGLAMNRVAGKPFTVSEYNHPAPSLYSAETLPLIMSYAAWQDWDGVFLFDYSAGPGKWGSGKIESFFAVDNHPAIMAFLPAAAALFLRGTPPTVEGKKILQVPNAHVLPLAAASGDTKEAWKAAGVLPEDVLKTSLAIEFVPDGELRVQETPTPTLNQNSAAPLQWSPADGQFQYISPAAQMAVSRYQQTGSADLGDWKYEITGSQFNFAALSLFSRDGRPLRQSQSLLLTVAGNAQNENIQWNAERTSIGDQWGNAPVLAEGISGNITLRTTAPNLAVYALDSSGNRAQTVPSRLSNGELNFAIGPQYKTLWYEVAATPN